MSLHTLILVPLTTQYCHYHPFEIVRAGNRLTHVEISCSRGFYVRSFIRDLGAALGSVATMDELIRTEQGDIKLGAV